MITPVFMIYEAQLHLYFFLYDYFAFSGFPCCSQFSTCELYNSSQPVFLFQNAPRNHQQVRLFQHALVFWLITKRKPLNSHAGSLRSIQ